MQDSKALQDTFERLRHRIHESTFSLQELLEGIDYPFEHSSGKIDLKTYLLPHTPNADEVVEFLSATDNFSTLFGHTCFRTTGKLAWLLEQLKQLLPESTQRSSNHQNQLSSSWPATSDSDSAVARTEEPTGALPSITRAMPPDLTEQGLLGRTMQSTLQAVVMESESIHRSIKRDNRKLIWICAVGGFFVLCTAVLFAFAAFINQSSRSIAGVTAQQAPPNPTPLESEHQGPIQADKIPFMTQRPLLYEFPVGQKLHYAIKVQRSSDDTSAPLWVGTCTLSATGDTTTNDEESSQGSGFVLARDGWIATRAQIVHTSKKVEVTIAGEKYMANVMAVDTESDLAILKVDANSLMPIALSDAPDVAMDQSISAFGFPLGDSRRGQKVNISQGNLTGTVNEPGLGQVIGIDMTLNPGQSGGPVVDRFGSVVGMVATKMAEGDIDNLAFATPIMRLKELVQRTQLDIQLASAKRSESMSYQQIAKEAQPSVCAIAARGKHQGTVATVKYQAVTQRMANQVFERPPQNTGRFQLSSLGSLVAQDTKDEHLSTVFGDFSKLLFEPLDVVHQKNCSQKRRLSIHPQPKSDVPWNDWLGQDNSSFSIPPPIQLRQFKSAIPASEEYQFQFKAQQDNLLVYDKTYKLRSLDNDNDPLIEIVGTGTWMFDLSTHASHSLHQNLRVMKRQSADRNFYITYQRLDSKEVQQLQQQRKTTEEQHIAKQRQHSEVPNPDDVRRLVEALKEAGFKGGSSWNLLQELSKIAVVPEMRTQVLDAVRPHVFPRSKEDSFMGDSTPHSVKAFCRWADVSCETEILTLLNSRAADMDYGPLLNLLGSFKKTEHISLLTKYLQNSRTRRDAKSALMNYDIEIEDQLLEIVSKTTDLFLLLEIIDLLGETAGTRKSIDTMDARSLRPGEAARWQRSKAKILERLGKAP